MTRQAIGLSFPRSRPRYTATASVATVTDPQRHAAALTVAERSHDVAELHELAVALGVTVASLLGETTTAGAA